MDWKGLGKAIEEALEKKLKDTGEDLKDEYLSMISLLGSITAGLAEKAIRNEDCTAERKHIHAAVLTLTSACTAITVREVQEIIDECWQVALKFIMAAL